MAEIENSARVRTARLALDAGPQPDKIAADVAEYAAARAGTYVTPAMVQRRVRIGFARAARELDRLADAGAVGKPDSRGRYPVPSSPREGE